MSKKFKLDTEQMPSSQSERLRFVLSGMVYMTETNDELNAALNWFYFGLLLSLADPMAAAGILFELEDQEGWSENYRHITRENVRLALDKAGRFIETKEASA